MPSWTWADTNQVQATAAILSILVTIVGIFFLLRQIRQIDSATRGQTHSFLYTHQDTITHFFIANPELRPLFYNNQELTREEVNLVVIKAVTEMVADFAEHIYLQLPNLPAEMREGWESYMKTLYNRSPSLRSHLGFYGDWYSEDFLSIISSSYVEPEKNVIVRDPQPAAKPRMKPKS